MTLDDNLRTELRAMHVNYDGFTADHLVERAVNATGRGPMRLGAPLATAAAVLAVAGGTAFALAGGGNGGHTPAGAGPSQPVGYSTPTQTTATVDPAGTRFTFDELTNKIKECVSYGDPTVWSTDAHGCGDALSQCQITAVWSTHSPCFAIPAEVISGAPGYENPTSSSAPSAPDKAPTGTDAPGSDTPTKSVAPGDPQSAPANAPAKSVAPTS